MEDDVMLLRAKGNKLPKGCLNPNDDAVESLFASPGEVRDGDALLKYLGHAGGAFYVLKLQRGVYAWKQITADLKQVPRQEDGIHVFLMKESSSGRAVKRHKPVHESESAFLKFVHTALQELTFEAEHLYKVYTPVELFSSANGVFPLFMRKAYKNLEEAIIKLTQENGTVNQFSIQGTAGIGKSVFGLFWTLKQAQSRGKVIWKVGPRYLFFDFSVGNLMHLDKAEIWDHFHDPRVWFIIDGKWSTQFSGKCNVLQVCSMKKENHHEFTKNSKCKVLYLPAWTLDEILLCAREYRQVGCECPQEEKIKSSFQILGGIPRYLLADPTKGEQNVLDVFTTSAYTIHDLLSVMSGNYVENMSDRLIHLVTDKDCGKRDVLFASHHVKAKLFNELVEKHRLEFKQWLEDKFDETGVATVWGQCFETYAIQCLSKGGTFPCKSLESNKQGSLSIHTEKKVKFNTLEELGGAEDKSFCAPTVSNLESIDCLYIEGKQKAVPLFQIFKRKNGLHSIKANGLIQIDKVLQAPHYPIYLVVPEKLCDKTRKQKYITSQNREFQWRTKDNQYLEEKLTQHVLSLDFSLLEKESEWQQLTKPR